MARKHRTIFSALACGLLLAGALPRTARAGGNAATLAPTRQSQTAQPQSVTEALTNLTTGEWAVRNAATLFLMRQPPTPDLQSTLEQTWTRTTNPEAAARLGSVLVHLHFKAQMKWDGDIGLLGIVLNPEPVRLPAPAPLADGRPAPDDLVVMSLGVVDLQPGFPAAEVLRPGDRIVGLNDQYLALDTTIEFFRGQINAIHPGREVSLLVVRDGLEQRMLVTVGAMPATGLAMANDPAGEVVQYVRHLLARAAGGNRINLPDPRNTPGQMLPLIIQNGNGRLILPNQFEIQLAPDQ